MHLAQKDLFWGMNIDFVKNVTDLAVHISCKEGEKIFEVGDQADHFYVLLKGSVIMDRGKDKWHTANNAGEIFGWSALIHRSDYAAHATCAVDSEILKIESQAFLKLLEERQENKATLYQHLSQMLGAQLLETYLSLSC
jgi:CRP/FNR family transcriptional regulator, cyclic AMP receptor protein